MEDNTQDSINSEMHRTQKTCLSKLVQNAYKNREKFKKKLIDALSVGQDYILSADDKIFQSIRQMRKNVLMQSKLHSKVNAKKCTNVNVIYMLDGSYISFQYCRKDQKITMYYSSSDTAWHNVKTTGFTKYIISCLDKYVFKMDISTGLEWSSDKNYLFFSEDKSLKDVIPVTKALIQIFKQYPNVEIIDIYGISLGASRMLNDLHVYTSLISSKKVLLNLKTIIFNFMAPMGMSKAISEINTRAINKCLADNQNVNMHLRIITGFGDMVSLTGEIFLKDIQHNKNLTQRLYVLFSNSILNNIDHIVDNFGSQTIDLAHFAFLEPYIFRYKLLKCIDSYEDMKAFSVTQNFFHMHDTEELIEQNNLGDILSNINQYSEEEQIRFKEYTQYSSAYYSSATGINTMFGSACYLLTYIPIMYKYNFLNQDDLNLINQKFNTNFHINKPYKYPSATMLKIHVTTKWQKYKFKIYNWILRLKCTFNTILWHYRIYKNFKNKESNIFMHLKNIGYFQNNFREKARQAILLEKEQIIEDA